MRSRGVGDKGEEMARRVLQRAGYFVLMNNFCVRGGEIDVIARAPDGTHVFVEVKLRRVEPEDHRSLLPYKKLTRMRRAAGQYLIAQSPTRIRYDLILLIPDEKNQAARVFWYKDIA